MLPQIQRSLDTAFNIQSITPQHALLLRASRQKLIVGYSNTPVSMKTPPPLNLSAGSLWLKRKPRRFEGGGMDDLSNYLGSKSTRHSNWRLSTF